MKDDLVPQEPHPWGGPEICQASIGTPLVGVEVGGMESFELPPPPKTLTFTDGTREAILDLTGDEVTYSGDLPMGESAKLFWNAVLGDLRARGSYARRLQARLVESPNNAEEGSFVRDAERWLESWGMLAPDGSEFPSMFQGMMDDYSDSKEIDQ